MLVFYCFIIWKHTMIILVASTASFLFWFLISTFSVFYCISYLQEHDTNVDFSFDCCFVQRGVIPGVARVWIGPVSQEKGADFEVAERAGVVKSNLQWIWLTILTLLLLLKMINLLVIYNVIDNWIRVVQKYLHWQITVIRFESKKKNFKKLLAVIQKVFQEIISTITKHVFFCWNLDNRKRSKTTVKL